MLMYYGVLLSDCFTLTVWKWEEQTLRVFDSRVLRGVFGLQRDEATGEWRRPHKEELNDLYSSPNTIRVIKQRRMSWAGHVARMGEKEMHTGFWWGDPREGDHLGDPGVDIKMDLQEVGWGHGLD
jgi:hypothetical protein